MVRGLSLGVVSSFCVGRGWAAVRVFSFGWWGCPQVVDGGLGGFGGNRRFLGGWVGDLVFEFDGAYHADTGVATPPVVDYFNPPGNRFFGFASGGPCPPVVEFHFLGGPKRFTHRRECLMVCV